MSRILKRFVKKLIKNAKDAERTGNEALAKFYRRWANKTVRNHA